MSHISAFSRISAFFNPKRLVAGSVLAIGLYGCPIYSDENVYDTNAPADTGRPVVIVVDSGPAICRSNSQCTSGQKCINGACTAPAEQCFDATQCKGKSQCVEGVCIATCDADRPCPTGYGCDVGKGVCTLNPTAPCAAVGGCASGTTCVSDRCVANCGPGGSCADGLVCVGGGCIPDEKPVFVCGADGTTDQCASGSICLHRSCYISCVQGSDTCKSADKFNQCKIVTTASGTFSVCGSDTNLGSECDVTQSKNCASPQVCIDGFCR